MALVPRTWLYLACLWLSIATALGHAVVPAGSPLAKGSGSAFSASTTDVALGPARTGPAKIKRVAPVAEDPDAGFGPDLPPLAASAPVLPLPATGHAPSAHASDQPAPSFPPVRSFDARAPPRR